MNSLIEDLAQGNGDQLINAVSQLKDRDSMKEEISKLAAQNQEKDV